MNPGPRRSATALGILGAVVAAAALVVLRALVGLPWLWALVIAAVAGAAAVGGLRLTAWRLLLRLAGGQAPDGAAEETLANVLEGLCVNHGIPAPELRVIQSDSINALAAARTPAHAGIVVTSGAVEQLERIELEGLLAHHLCRIRRGDAAFETLAGILLAWPLGAVGWLRSRVMGRVLPAGRSLKADFEAVSLTRYPPGLLSALMTISGQTPEVPSATVAALHMWIDEPDWGIADAVRHPGLQTRIAALSEL
ncbi:M48 family metalloprotease [Candidatus Poriferisocius sp.]|uniref:M48 family metalloprotease n=1 Tax=Candidatus Poriferisocius sp. TaxID=3101276 RepID=UPI003B028A71